MCFFFHYFHYWLATFCIQFRSPCVSFVCFVSTLFCVLTLYTYLTINNGLLLYICCIHTILFSSLFFYQITICILCLYFCNVLFYLLHLLYTIVYVNVRASNVYLAKSTKANFGYYKNFSSLIFIL